MRKTTPREIPFLTSNLSILTLSIVYAQILFFAHFSVIQYIKNAIISPQQPAAECKSPIEKGRYKQRFSARWNRGFQNQKTDNHVTSFERSGQARRFTNPY
ncbi:MAG TPA: hypothetical protein VF199_11290 [Bacillales bacterium]